MAAISQSKAFISVGIEIQKEVIKTLTNYLFDLNELKKEYVLRNLENEANLVYCFENSLKTIQHELQMLVEIKEGRMSEAWTNLVNAEIIMGTVISNYPFETELLENYLNRLAAYEKLLFPKMFFQSIGGIVRKSHCSICNEDFKMRDHEKGKLYNGDLCCRITVTGSWK